MSEFGERKGIEFKASASLEKIQNPVQEPVVETNASSTPDTTREVEPQLPLYYEQFDTFVMAPGNSDPFWGNDSKKILTIDQSGTKIVGDDEDFSWYIPSSLKTRIQNDYQSYSNQNESQIARTENRISLLTVTPGAGDGRGGGLEGMDKDLRPGERVGVTFKRVEGISFAHEEFSLLLSELTRRGIIDECFNSVDVWQQMLDADKNLTTNQFKSLPMSREYLQWWLQKVKADMASDREYVKPEKVPPLPDPGFVSISNLGTKEKIGGQLGILAKFSGDVKNNKVQAEQALEKINSELSDFSTKYPDLLKKYRESRVYIGARFDEQFTAALTAVGQTIEVLKGVLQELKTEKDSKKFVEIKFSYPANHLAAYKKQLEKLVQLATLSSQYKQHYLQNRTVKQ